ncbi:MAG: hypothetical protein Kow0031_29000 [Anaerolineae bacterium]
MSADEVALEIARILLENEIRFLAWQRETVVQQAQAAAPAVDAPTPSLQEAKADDKHRRK